MSGIDRLIERVEVKTYVHRLCCPNEECDGVLEFDGKERAKDGKHGGPPEYRHKCTKCEVGYWVKDQYPQLKYELVPGAEPEQVNPEPKIPIKRFAWNQ
jgi:hypothetical protein